MRSSIEEAARAVAAGKFVIVADDEQRENEGDLIMAAEMVTADKIAFMLRHTSGIICEPMTAQRLSRLALPQMVTHNTESHRTAFTISVDCRYGTTTGVSAADRATTIRALADSDTSGDDFLRPGHIFPLRYSEGGVLKRAGHTEATVDLARLAGLQPCGILCELTNDDGTMMRMPQLETFSSEHDLPLITVSDLIAYRCANESIVKLAAESQLVTEYGTFTAHVYEDQLSLGSHLVLSMGDVTQQESVLARVHRACLMGDLFNSKSCTCGSKLRSSLRQIAREGAGVVVYLRGLEEQELSQHERTNKPVSQDGLVLRELGIGSQILREMGVRRLRLLTNTPVSYAGLSGFDLEVVERVPIIMPVADGVIADAKEALSQ